MDAILDEIRALRTELQNLGESALQPVRLTTAESSVAHAKLNDLRAKIDALEIAHSVMEYESRVTPSSSQRKRKRIDPYEFSPTQLRSKRVPH